jgi:hypothetical protein
LVPEGLISDGRCKVLDVDFGRCEMASTMTRDQAHKLVDTMAEDATWDDLMQEIYVREAIEEGLADSRAGKTRDVREIRERYGLPE